MRKAQIEVNVIPHMIHPDLPNEPITINGQFIDLGREHKFVVCKIISDWWVFEYTTGVCVCDCQKTRKQVIENAENSISRFSDKQIAISVANFPVLNS